MKAFGFLWNILTAEIPGGNLRKAVDSVLKILGSQELELEVSFEENGKKRTLKVKGNNPKELEEALARAQDFLESRE